MVWLMRTLRGPISSDFYSNSRTACYNPLNMKTCDYRNEMHENQGQFREWPRFPSRYHASLGLWRPNTGIRFMEKLRLFHCMAWSIKLFWIQHAASMLLTSLGRSAKPAQHSDKPIIIEVSARAFKAGKCKICFRYKKLNCGSECEQIRSKLCG